MKSFHVGFNVMTTIERFVTAADEDDATEKAAEAPDSSDDFHDCDWQTEWVHEETPRCRTPGEICWEETR